ncbi:hypothetical protein SY88_23545 [Clostridiales bacterium PH28_bin88]|nr:hypothetical protein SY88_23545 [Clostridiales bacterium PH28_bin88]
MDIFKFFKTNGWEVSHTVNVPESPGMHHDPTSLNLSSASMDYLRACYNGIYLHQKIAIEKFREDNICISTKTASGKSLVFHVCGLEILASDPESKLLAIYPLRALGTEQQAKWQAALKKVPGSGGLLKVGRIDGGVPVNRREQILRESSVIVMTPDVVHAWLLSNLAKQYIQEFIRRLSLIVVDEAHVYTGVFGSNSAYLFRRLHHVSKLCGGNYKYIVASATISDAQKHVQQLLGVDVSIIDSTVETSPKKELSIYLVNHARGSDQLSSLAQFMSFLVNETKHNFITFVDSRKQTEHLASIIQRSKDDSGDDLAGGNLNANLLQGRQVCPYRSGYEENDRNNIQELLTSGALRGVISTSALEMGIDIPHLTLGILVGVPNSATSFYQRLGRIGRNNKGTVVIVNDGSIGSELIFREPDRLFTMPLSESSLYLENERIQYIHTLCLARRGGEDDAINYNRRHEQDQFKSEASFPESFVSLCNDERIGDIPPHLQPMKSLAGEDPNHVYPLRDVDIQFKVECKSGTYIRDLGTLSFAQVMREAYPGAIYYYQAKSFRVYKVNTVARKVETRPERQYTTKPNHLPTLIFPNLSEGNVQKILRFGELCVAECNLQIRESLGGFKETRGRTEMEHPYPLDGSSGIYFDLPRFTRNYFTSGVILSHPTLDHGIRCSIIADILYEAFLMTIPYERQDVGFGDDRHRTSRAFASKDSRFVAIYDQTYGSLRLTSRMTEPDLLKDVFSDCIKIAKDDPRFQIAPLEIAALEAIRGCLDQPPIFDEYGNQKPLTGPSHERVIIPGSKGINVHNGNNEEFFIEGIFLHPRDGLMYRGRHLSQQSKRYSEASDRASKVTILVPIKYIAEIPGESEIGLYNFETGEIENAEVASGI